MFGLFTATVLAFAPAPAKPVLLKPSGSAPQIKYVSVMDNGAIAATEIATQMVPIEKTVNVIVNGAPQIQKIISYQSVTFTTLRQIDMKSLTVTNTDGKEIDKNDLPKLLKGGAMVIWSAKGKPVDPAYLRIFKEGTLVFVVPPPVPAPVPAANR